MLRDRGLRYWLPTYVAQSLWRRKLRAQRKRALTHLLVLVCDHFEPQHAATDAQQPAERIRKWHIGYKQMQDECFAKYGLRPLHSWFYPPHHGYEHLPALARMAFDGLGEIELHYHHHDDTEETLRAGLRDVLNRYQRAGVLLQCGEPPRRRFGFIHGDWALDNSSNGRFCGVNSELSLLQELGCWADLTMPSGNECQTRKINSIYYAIDDKDKPKSHDWGEDACVDRPDREGIMLMQGPLGLNFRAPRYPRVENASLTANNWGSQSRIRSWIDCHVHVRGRPQWLFIKLHTHGAIDADMDALFGDKAKEMHRMLAEHYNDGRRFQLHYVTARQAFNVVRAAEHGMVGDPSQFLDYELPPQVTSFYCSSSPHALQACTSERLVINQFEENSISTLLLRYPGIREVIGPIRSLTLDTTTSTLQIEPCGGASEVTVKLAPGTCVGRLAGATIIKEDPVAGAVILAPHGLISLECKQTPERAAVVA